MHGENMFVPLRQATVQRIFDQAAPEDKNFDQIIARLLQKTSDSDRDGTKSTSSPHYRRSRTRGQRSFTIFCEKYIASSAREVMTMVLKIFSGLDEKFLEKLSLERGRTRPIVCTSPEQLYPGSPHLAQQCYYVGHGYYVGTNYSETGIARILKIACRVAGIEYGSDLVTDLREYRSVQPLSDEELFAI